MKPDCPLGPPRVKCCGMTRLEDARLAVEAGADALGVVLHPPSPRYVHVYGAARLLNGVPESLLKVAVLVDRSPEEAAFDARRIGARAVQLCGGERPEDFAGFPLPVLRRLAVEAGAEEELEAWRDRVLAFVLDAPGSPGGSGRRVDPDRAAALAERAPCLLAGGLDDGNVAEAVRAVRPWGVDASSGLELRPGAKDPERLRRFVERARAARAEIGA